MLKGSKIRVYVKQRICEAPFSIFFNFVGEARDMGPRGPVWKLEKEGRKLKIDENSIMIPFMPLHQVFQVLFFWIFFTWNGLPMNTSSGCEFIQKCT